MTGSVFVALNAAERRQGDEGDARRLCKRKLLAVGKSGSVVVFFLAYAFAFVVVVD